MPGVRTLEKRATPPPRSRPQPSPAPRSPARSRTPRKRPQRPQPEPQTSEGARPATATHAPPQDGSVLQVTARQRDPPLPTPGAAARGDRPADRLYLPPGCGRRARAGILQADC
ncbi:uncharacterized protein LOC144284672 [Canis aureus]